MVNLSHKRRIDALLGGVVAAALNLAALATGGLRRRPPSPGAPRRVLVIKLLGLGSLANAGHLLQAMREAWPQAHLSLLCARELVPIAERLSGPDELLVIDDRSALSLARSLGAFLRQARRERYDIVADLEFRSNLTAILCVLTSAPVRAGFYLCRPWRRAGIYTTAVAYDPRVHVQELYRRLGTSFGLEPTVGPPPPPRVEPEEFAAADRWLAALPPAPKLLLVNVNAGELCLERRWEPEAFAQVVTEAASRGTVRVVLTGSRAEREYVESVRLRVSEPARAGVVNAAGELRFGEFLALLTRADLLLTNDTGPLHLAVALGTPTVSLWGPTLPEAYGPLAGRHRVLRHPVPCAPCVGWAAAPTCRGRNICMQAIAPTEVTAAVDEMLQIVTAEP